MSWLVSWCAGGVGRQEGRRAEGIGADQRTGAWVFGLANHVGTSGLVPGLDLIMLLQSFHLAAKNLHMLLTPPGHFKQTGVSIAVCQTDRGRKSPSRSHTRPGDSATGQKCTETTKFPKTVRLKQHTYMAIAQRQVSKWCRVVSKEVPQQPCHSSASEFGLSCKPHELSETSG